MFEKLLRETEHAAVHDIADHIRGGRVVCWLRYKHDGLRLGITEAIRVYVRSALDPEDVYYIDVTTATYARMLREVPDEIPRLPNRRNATVRCGRCNDLLFLEEYALQLCAACEEGSI